MVRVQKGVSTAYAPNDEMKVVCRIGMCARKMARPWAENTRSAGMKFGVMKMTTRTRMSQYGGPIRSTRAAQ